MPPRVPLLKDKVPASDRSDAKAESARMEGEYLDFHRAISKASPTRMRGKKILRGMKKEAEDKTRFHDDNVGNAVKLRQSILAISLFPNIYNRETIMRDATD